MINLIQKYSKSFLFTFIFCISFFVISDDASPNLAITSKDINLIKNNIDNVLPAKKELDSLIENNKKYISSSPVVPYPKDAGGGYTHEQHKTNYRLLYENALIFQLTKNVSNLLYVKDLFLEYARIYPSLDLHPKQKEQSPGKIFWQSLNEAMWLFYAIQAYDMVKNSLSVDDKNKIENNLLRPMAIFLSKGQPDTFNKIHNHGTWAAASVGMTGYVLNDKNFVDQALYGLDKSGNAGFLKQLDNLFSPDGYYEEGPYYQRFALLPFVIFAKAIDSNQPELKIFDYRDGIILKSIYTSVQLSYNKLFFPINDVIKDKGINTIELVHAIAIAYDITSDNTLLEIAKYQNHILLTGYGFKVAQALNLKKERPFTYRTVNLRDGINGKKGALAIIRNNENNQTIVMKNTSHGLNHGHFDKLSWIFYDNNNEIVQDYGSARFLNVVQKNGGHYLKENNSFAKQTIAHNTLVVNETSQFNGDWKVSQNHAPEILFFQDTKGLKITSAKFEDAYEGVIQERTIASVHIESLEFPIVVDFYSINSNKKNKYDLPLYYNGHLISQTGNLSYHKVPKILGNSSGYEYIYEKGFMNAQNSLEKITWLKDNRFYTVSIATEDDSEILFGQLGANDKNFNLRSENLFIHRVDNKSNHNYLSVLEPHGEYNPRYEFTKNPTSSLKSLNGIVDGEITLIKLLFLDDSEYHLVFTKIGDDETSHNYTTQLNNYEWKGHSRLFTIKK